MTELSWKQHIDVANSIGIELRHEIPSRGSATPFWVWTSAICLGAVVSLISISKGYMPFLCY